MFRATRAVTMLALSPEVSAASASLLLHAGAQQHVAVEADALHRPAAEARAEAREGPRVAVDDGDLVLPGEAQRPARPPCGRSLRR